MIQYIKCDVDCCVHNDGNRNCTIPVLSIDLEITASGFYPICQDYEEKEEGEEE